MSQIRKIAELHDKSIDAHRAWKAAPDKLKAKHWQAYKQAETAADDALNTFLPKEMQ